MTEMSFLEEFILVFVTTTPLFYDNGFSILPLNVSARFYKQHFVVLSKLYKGFSSSSLVFACLIYNGFSLLNVNLINLIILFRVVTDLKASGRQINNILRKSSENLIMNPL